MSTTVTTVAGYPRIVHDDFAFGPPGSALVADFTTREGVHAACPEGFLIGIHNGKPFAVARGKIVIVTLPEATQSCEFLLYHGASAANGRMFRDDGTELTRFVVPTSGAGSRLDRVSCTSQVPLRRVEFDFSAGEGGLDSISFIALHANQTTNGVDVSITGLLGGVSVPVPGAKTGSTDLIISDPIAPSDRSLIAGNDRLVFDGYSLSWNGDNPQIWPAFSGASDESANEAVADIGPTPQGRFVVDPANIEKFGEHPDWGGHRVKIEPMAATVRRMADCLKVIRTGMYVHGGNAKGTHGCIELNSDADEKAFFKRLAEYGGKIELEVRYSGARAIKYELKACPYP